MLGRFQSPTQAWASTPAPRCSMLGGLLGSAGRRAWNRSRGGKNARMEMESDYYNVYEAARVLGISPARVRQMLRAGELEGERGEQRVEGVMGPWRLPAGAVHAARSVAGASDAEATVAMQPGEAAITEGATDAAGEAPSETSERLSEGVQELRDKAEALIAGLDSLEGRLEAAEMEQLALKEELGRAEERSEGLRTELEAERKKAGHRDQRGPAWRRWLGGE